MLCLFGAEFVMTATVLRTKGSPDTNTAGHWETGFNSDSGAPERIWVQDLDSATTGIQALTISCVVKGVLNSGIIGAGDTQKFDDVYENIGWAKMTFGDVHLSNRDQVTNIKNANNIVVFRNEEAESYNHATDEWIVQPTVFNVMGVTPVTDPFGNVMKNIALLKRAEIQI